VHGLDLDSSAERDVGLLRLEGEARVESTEVLRDAIRGLQNEGCRAVLLDLGKLSFMDSASAGTLLQAKQEIEAADGGVLVLFGLTRMVARLLDSAGLADHFVVAASEEAARLRVSGGL